MGEAAGSRHHPNVHAPAPSNAKASPSPITEQADPLEPRSNVDLGRSVDRGSHEAVQSKAHVGRPICSKSPVGFSSTHSTSWVTNKAAGSLTHCGQGEQ